MSTNFKINHLISEESLLQIYDTVPINELQLEKIEVDPHNQVCNFLFSYRTAYDQHNNIYRYKTQSISFEVAEATVNNPDTILDISQLLERTMAFFTANVANMDWS